jgi:rhodanese-related sulfurtransferase
MNFDWLFTSIKKIGFEDVKMVVDKCDKRYIIINTLPVDLQECLIKNTIPFNEEEKVINDLLDNYEMKKIHVLLYGKNGVDATADKKYKQLMGLGFSNIYIYVGGLFEWLLLQDIYGSDEFQTSGKIKDILKLKPERIIL